MSLGKTKSGIFSPAGRGGHYSILRGVMESVMRIVYAGDWPAFVWGHLPGTCRIQTVRHTIRCEQSALPARLRVGFISDLHIGPSTPQLLLENAIDALVREKPDAVILGGDYVFLDSGPAHMRILESLLLQIEAKTKVAVLGNHDLWTDDKTIEKTLVATGFRIITNDAIYLPSPHNHVAILGLDEPRTGVSDVAKALSGTKSAAFRIAVCHSPNGASGLLGRVDVFLAGHTHGGQIALPGGYPVILPKGEGCRKWPQGRFTCGNTEIIVSRGLGGTELPIRLFSPPEVIIIDLLPDSHTDPVPN
jgi:uncharacterized protein